MPLLHTLPLPTRPAWSDQCAFATLVLFEFTKCKGLFLASFSACCLFYLKCSSLGFLCGWLFMSQLNCYILGRQFLTSLSRPLPKFSFTASQSFLLYHFVFCNYLFTLFMACLSYWTGSSMKVRILFYSLLYIQCVVQCFAFRCLVSVFWMNDLLWLHVWKISYIK